MGLVLAIIGLVGLLLPTQYFQGQHAVALGLLVVGIVLLAAQVAWTVYVGRKVHREFRRHDQWLSPHRRHRGF